MNPLPFVLAFALASRAIAADRPPVPAGPIAEKKELLFSDDFEAEPAKPWHKVVPTFAVERGTLKGTQTRDKSVPAADGKPAVTAHAAVHGLDIPTKDSVVASRKARWASGNRARRRRRNLPMALKDGSSSQSTP